MRWQRLRTVAGRRCGALVTSTRKLPGGGSSSVLSNAFAAFTVMRSASSSTAALLPPRTAV